MFHRLSKSLKNAQNEWSNFLTIFYPQLFTLIHKAVLGRVKYLLTNTLAKCSGLPFCGYLSVNEFFTEFTLDQKVDN